MNRDGYPVVSVDYTNWRGERRIRRIAPMHITYGSNEWHPEPQHLLEAVDNEDGKAKTFALAGIHAWGDAAERPPSQPFRCVCRVPETIGTRTASEAARALVPCALHVTWADQARADERAKVEAEIVELIEARRSSVEYMRSREMSGARLVLGDVRCCVLAGEHRRPR
jgi:hypothetical protein